MTSQFICPIHGLVEAVEAALFERDGQQLAGYKCEHDECNIYRLAGELEYPEG